MNTESAQPCFYLAYNKTMISTKAKHVSNIYHHTKSQNTAKCR